MLVVATEVPFREAAGTWVGKAYEDYRDRLVDFGEVLTRDRAAAEDLAQEIFLRALATLQDRPDYWIERSWPWLCRAMWRSAAAWRRARIRRERREALAMPALVQPPPDDGAIDFERALRRLPPRMRACAALVYGRGLTQKHAAIILGCSERTVETHLRRARPRLHRALALVEDPAVGMPPVDIPVAA